MHRPLKFMATAAACLFAGQALAQVSVTHAWVRASVPGQQTSGAFMTITSAHDARLVGVRSSAAGVAEIHETHIQDNVARMRRAAAIELPAGRPVELKAGGYHVMLIDLKRPLKEGDKVGLTLLVQGKGGKPQSVHIEASVRPLGAATHGHGH